MGKKAIGPQPLLWPHPAVLVGASVNGQPDFAAVAWAGIAGGTPPMVSVALRHSRHTLKGVHQNLTFSVNIPSEDIVRETDYCGIVSGKESDKVKACHFKIFYGNLVTAPLIEQCPVNLECQVAHILDLGSHALVVGQIVEVHVSEECLTHNKPDIRKIRPFTYASGKYHAVGEVVAEAFSIGKELKEAKRKSNKKG